MRSVKTVPSATHIIGSKSLIGSALRLLGLPKLWRSDSQP